MKKILTTLSAIAIFCACIKEKAIPPQQQNIKSESNSSLIVTSVKPVTNTSEDGDDIMALKKKVAKTKYSKQKPKKK
ncbi:hypothetical protein FRZ67_22665 [Panacibacter ginsenosidivorans]|uniref:Lipoprotein n=1 Tax=Panacibacter ginsenosidivorans TaxID=1813871 RepID=A0A5B8VFV7_9BACT|nr:hypothetical protein [Panacibacter ginsenosidivorans]QEC69961.1 hypothetical protein FRZ67_22665 [Panacibacter ginsenosidivorans]